MSSRTAAARSTVRSTAATLDSVLDDPRSLLRVRVLRAARLLIAENGLGVSMDDVAVAADVGRRTLFRHFDSRDALIAAAVESAFDWYDTRVESITKSEAPVEQWLTDLVARLHALHRSAGRGLWQLAASDDADLPAELVKINRRRRRRRRATTELIAAELWRRAGGTGTCPPTVVDTCGLTLSSFASRSMLDDLGTDLERLTQSSTQMLLAVARAELDTAAVRTVRDRR